MTSGVTIAKTIFATGDDNGKLPEKYIRYGSIKTGADTASMMSSRRSIPCVSGIQ
jgi:hypothetical protein